MHHPTRIILTIFLIPTLFCCSSDRLAHSPKKNAKHNNTALSASGLAPATPSLKKLEEQMHVEINAYRSTIGKKPLTYHKGLSNYARQHSRFMADNPGRFAFFYNNISHQYFEYRRTVAKHRYDLRISENVIAGHHSDREAVSSFIKSWLRSPGHKKNLHSSWKTSGIGAARGQDGKLYFTQLFGVPNYHKSIHSAGYLGPKNW